MNKQQALIKEYLEAEVEKLGILVDEEFSISNEVERNIHRIYPGELLALDIEDNHLLSISKVDGLASCSTINSEAILISLNKLENYFYDKF